MDVVEIEHCEMRRLEDVVAAYQFRLSRMRQRHPVNPPDGFVVLDENGNELRLWLGKS